MGPISVCWLLIVVVLSGGFGGWYLGVYQIQDLGFGFIRKPFTSLGHLCQNSACDYHLSGAFWGVIVIECAGFCACDLRNQRFWGLKRGMFESFRAHELIHLIDESMPPLFAET